MALIIKSEATKRLALQISGETGESVAEVIQKSLEERRECLKRQRRGQIEDLLCRVDALPSQNSQSENEILGYDENGIPR
jgi:antitoxin VapB